MNYKKPITFALGLVLAGGILAGPASAAGFSAQLDKSLFLNPKADTVTVTLSGVPANQGVYVRLCAVPADKTQRPTLCDGQGKWVSSFLASTMMGAGKASDPVKLDVKAAFGSGDGAVNCLAVACAIHTRRDHFGGSGDFALDRYYPVSFTTPKATVSVKSGKVTFVVTGSKGATVKLAVGSAVLNRKITSDSQKFTMVVAKGKSAKASVSLGAKVLAYKTVKG